MIEGYPGEIKEKIQRKAWQKRQEMKLAAQEEKKQQTQGYDRTATPASIANLGQPVSEARLGGALASLAYEENRLKEINQKLAQEEPTSKLPATLGAMGKWLKSDTELEQLQTQRRIRELQNKIPQLEYETWEDRGVMRPEEYTAENVGDYLERSMMLANLPWEWTNEQKEEAKQILYTQMGGPGLFGIGNNVWAFQPYQDAVRNKDTELAKQWETTYNRLYSRLYPRETAVVGAIQKSMGIRSFNEVLGTVLDASDEAWERYEEQVKNEDIAMAKHPVLSGITQMAGGMALYGAVDSVNGKILSSLGSGGVLMPYVKAGVNLGGTTAIREAGDLATGRLSWQEYARNILAMERMGMISSALADKLAELYDFYSSGGFESGAASSAGQGGTALVPVQPSTGAALAGNGEVNILPILPETGDGGKSSSPLDGKKAKKQKDEEEFDKAFLKGYNEEEDREEWEYFLEVLGRNEVPQNFRQFQDIKYEQPEVYEAIKHGAEYVENQNQTLKEELESGRAREETKDTFVQRAIEEGYTTYEQGTAIFGFRRMGNTAECGYIQENARNAQASFEAWKELRALGIEADIIEGTVLSNYNGITKQKEIPEAATLGHGRVVINANTTINGKEAAGHEAFHLWKNGVGRNDYTEVLNDNLVVYSEDFLKLQDEIARAYFGEDVDINDEMQMRKMSEELFAYISGQIHAGIYDEFLRPMFRDYEAVKAAWYELIRKNR